jgi:hypothetical protein
MDYPTSPLRGAPQLKEQLTAFLASTEERGWAPMPPPPPPLANPLAYPCRNPCGDGAGAAAGCRRPTTSQI